MEARVENVSNWRQEGVLVPDQGTSSNASTEQVRVSDQHDRYTQWRDTMPEEYDLLPESLLCQITFSEVGICLWEEEKDKQRATTTKCGLQPEDNSP